MVEHRLASPDNSPYDGIADCYEQTRPDYPPAALAILSARPGELVADVGAGTGIFSRQLAQALPDARVQAVQPFFECAMRRHKQLINILLEYLGARSRHFWSVEV